MFKPNKLFKKIIIVIFTIIGSFFYYILAIPILKGSILVHVKNDLESTKYDDLEIPWRAQMLDGQLEIDESERRFICSEIRDESGSFKRVQIRNTLAMPIILYQIRLEDNQV